MAHQQFHCLHQLRTLDRSVRHPLHSALAMPLKCRARFLPMALHHTWAHTSTRTSVAMDGNQFLDPRFNQTLVMDCHHQVEESAEVVQALDPDTTETLTLVSMWSNPTHPTEISRATAQSTTTDQLVPARESFSTYQSLTFQNHSTLSRMDSRLMDSSLMVSVRVVCTVERLTHSR